MNELELLVVPYGDPDATRLIAQVQAEYTRLYGGPDESPIEPADFTAPTGLFVVGRLGGPGGTAVATGAWRARPEVSIPGASRPAEIKRMYVTPAHRGRGFSRAVLRHLERSAAAAGHDALVLETGTMQPAAIGLYTANGYAAIKAFGHYRDSPLSVYLGRLLPPVSPAGR